MKIYCGNGKTINGQYGNFDALNLDIEVLIKHAYTAKNGKRYCNIIVSDKREADKYGNNKNLVISIPPDKKPEVTAQEHAPARTQLNDEGVPF